ncbi:MAG: hypothetical protein AAB871_02660 [Patescibacteria group bacterium]
MKKTIYIFCFTILGILVGFLFPALFEIIYINLLLTNFSRWGLGLTLSQWFSIHYYYSFLTFALGVVLGFWQGFYWWKVIYVEKRYDKWKRGKWPKWLCY